MKYLKLFNNHSDYVNYINDEFDEPNVSYCLDRTDEVHYNPTRAESVLTAIFNVEDASEPTRLYLYMSEQDVPFEFLGVNMFDKAVIDGTEVSVADLDADEGTYQLSAGEHTVAYTLKDPTLIGVIEDEQTETITRYGIIFDNIESLTSVTIPGSVTTISGGAFGACSNLTSVTFEDTSNLTIANCAFDECRKLNTDTRNTIAAINPQGYCVSN